MTDNSGKVQNVYRAGQVGAAWRAVDTTRSGSGVIVTRHAPDKPVRLIGSKSIRLKPSKD